MLGKRILLLGTGGAGKSTLAKEMGELLGLEVIHLDSHFWEPGWVLPEKEKWNKVLNDLMNKDSYIMDGNYTKTVYERGLHADTAILIDMPRVIAIWRIVKRRIKYRNVTRPDMREGCNEKLDWPFVKWVWNYPRKKQVILNELHRSGIEVIVLKGKRGVKQFRNKLIRDYRG